MQTHIFSYNETFELENGTTLPGFHLAYSTWGVNRGNNIVWVFHALTANSRPDEWWPGLVGSGKFFDPDQHFIICVNMPGSPYGSINPLNINEETNGPWLLTFPQFTVADMVRCYKKLGAFLGITKAWVGIGGSMGGQQLLEWCVQEPHFFEYAVPLATNGAHSAWGHAFNATQRMCLEADAEWGTAKENAAQKGLHAARAVAMLSYRSYEGYAHTQPGYYETDKQVPQLSRAESYQRYQGKKLANRFDAYCYYFLSKSMDLHDLGRGRENVIAALKMIRAKTMVISITSDLLFPPAEQAFLATQILMATLHTIDSLFGHDGFLIESEKITNALTAFLHSKTKN